MVGQGDSLFCGNYKISGKWHKISRYYYLKCILHHKNVKKNPITSLFQLKCNIFLKICTGLLWMCDFQGYKGKYRDTFMSGGFAKQSRHFELKKMYIYIVTKWLELILTSDSNKLISWAYLVLDLGIGGGFSLCHREYDPQCIGCEGALVLWKRFWC